MTKRFCAALLIAVLTLLTGCSARAAVNTPAEGRQQTPTAAPGQTGPSAQFLTVEEAQAIALDHAGFAPDQVSFLRTEPELWDHVPHYDVEFQEGRWEYDYEIHAETGAILSFEKDD